MQVFEVIACHVGINLSRGDVGMAQHGLNRPQIGAAFQQVARKGVPQRVGRDHFSEPCPKTVTLDQLPKTLAAERFSGPGDKKSGTHTVFEKRLACPVGLSSDFFLSILADRHHAFLGAFAENANITGGQIDIL